MHKYHVDTGLQRMFILNIRMGEQFGFKHGMVLLGFSDRNVSRVLQNGMINPGKKIILDAEGLQVETLC